MTTLSPSRIWGEHGAGNRVRTGDLNLGKVALYQLSYSRTLLRVSTAVVAGNGVSNLTAPIVFTRPPESRTIPDNSRNWLNYKELSLSLITTQAAFR